MHSGKERRTGMVLELAPGYLLLCQCDAHQVNQLYGLVWLAGKMYSWEGSTLQGQVECSHRVVCPLSHQW